MKVKLDSSYRVYCFLSGVICISLVILSILFEQKVYGDDPSSHIVKSTFNFCATGSFISEEDLKKHEEYRKFSEINHGVYWQDRYVLTARNELLPQHAALARILLAPFVCTLGDNGIRIAMGACLFGIFLGAWLIHLTLTGNKASPILLFISIALGTHILLTGAALNYDLFYTAALLLGVGMSLNGKSLLGGSFLGLTLLIRPNILLFYPFVLVVLFLSCRSRSYIQEWCIGVGSFILLVFALNWHLFGSPFLTFYHTMPIYDHGSIKLNIEPAAMSLDILIQDWSSKLFDSRVGILLWNPALFLSLICLPFYCRALRREEWVLILGILVQVAIVFSRSAWAMSFVGNRYLQGFVILFIVMVLSVLTKERGLWHLQKVKSEQG